MRLTGIINGSITLEDRPTFFGEPFDLTATTQTPGVSNWTNLTEATAENWTSTDEDYVTE